MKIELQEGEYICPICNGTGNDERAIWICDKCDGEGKVDWVSQVVTRSIVERMSTLRRVNIRNILNHIKTNIAGEIFPNIQNMKQQITSYLSTCQQNFAIDDFNVICDETNFHNIDIFIKPTRTTEQVRLTLKIEK